MARRWGRVLGATAADIEALIRHVREVVARVKGVVLETEVCIVGERLAGSDAL